MRHVIRFTLFISALLCAKAIAQNHGHSEPGKANLRPDSVGTVDFRNSCDSLMRKDINHAVAQLHSFWFGASRKVFELVLENDPNCAIAYWGIALTHWGNPFAGAKAPDVIAAGRQAIDRAAATSRKVTPRERGYIDAVAILFSDANPGTHRSRIERYETAMEKLAATYPDDVEARIFWALAIAQAAEPSDKTYKRLLRSGSILEPMFAKLPQHPGIAHYIIHAYDAPPLAEKALPAARAYADIAPAAPHALHMPSHTFTRVGLWQESVATNIRSADTADRYGEPESTMHALDYMMYGYLQMAMDSEANATLERANKIRTTNNAFAAGFAAMALPARYALERQQWSDAAALSVPENVPPNAEAMRRFARAIGAARSGKLDAVPAELERLAVLRDQLLNSKDAYWAGAVDRQRGAANAWLLFARGNKNEAIATLRLVADAEDATDKSAVTPGPLAPAREMLGFMLLEADRANDSLIEFDTAIAKEPNRFLALYGAGRAAEKAGQSQRAKRYFEQIARITKGTNSDRPELAYARKNAG